MQDTASVHVAAGKHPGKQQNAVQLLITYSLEWKTAKNVQETNSMFVSVMFTGAKPLCV